MDRRSFLKSCGTAAVAAAAAPALASCTEGGRFGCSQIKKARQSYDTDVLVIGGGPAGVCAAIAASREGARTMVVEAGACLGGMATRGLVSPFMTSFDSRGEVMCIRGLFEEIVGNMVTLGGAIHPKDVRHTSPYSAWITAGHDHCTPFDAEIMKVVLENMCTVAGVKMLYHAQFVEPVLKGRSVAGAVLLTRSGFEAVSAKVVIDATGDGDVAFRAGVPCDYGNPSTGKAQPATLFFHINNVDSARLEADVQKHLHEFRKVNGVSYRALHWRVAEAEAAREWDIARKSVNIYKGVRDDEWAVNSTRISGVDSTSSESLTEAEIEGRRQVQELMNFFHKYVPGCENATLKSSASTMGIRESRHIRGEHILDAQELVKGLVPDDTILVASNSVDVHGAGGKGAAAATTYTVIETPWYGVPYRCLVPLGVDGLLVAGRCLSATSDAAGAVRVMPPVMAMGQAAGIAAALCVKGGLQPRNADTEAIRSRLLECKAFLG